MIYFWMLLIALATFLGYKISMKREPDKDFKPKDESDIVTLITMIICLIAPFFVEDKLVLAALCAFAIFSYPMNVSDFQCYYLPKVSSIIYEIFMIFTIPMLFSATSYLDWGKMLLVYAIAAVVLTVLCIITNFGFADAYVGAWIAIPLFIRPNLLISTMVAFIVSTLILVAITYFKKGRKITHIPYVPALNWTIMLGLLLANII